MRTSLEKDDGDINEQHFLSAVIYLMSHQFFDVLLLILKHFLFERVRISDFPGSLCVCGQSRVVRC